MRRACSSSLNKLTPVMVGLLLGSRVPPADSTATRSHGGRFLGDYGVALPVGQADHRSNRHQPGAAVPVPLRRRRRPTIAIANRAGYVPVRWSVDTLGWEGTAGHISAAVVAARVLAALRPGGIVLMHAGSNPGDHSTFAAAALPQVINELRSRGYSFVTLDALVG